MKYPRFKSLKPGDLLSWDFLHDDTRTRVFFLVTKSSHEKEFGTDVPFTVSCISVFYLGKMRHFVGVDYLTQTSYNHLLSNKQANFILQRAKQRTRKKNDDSTL